MALPASESFTNSDGVGLTTHSASWTYNSGTFAINTNAVRPNSGGENGARWNADSFNADHYSTITVTSLSAAVFIGVAVRLDTGSAVTYYLYYVSSTNRYFGKLVAGTYTDLQTPAGAGASVSDVFSLEVSGTAITPKRNGSLDSAFTTATDSAIASGAAGIAGFDSSSSARGDDWTADNLSTTVRQRSYPIGDLRGVLRGVA